MDISQENKKVAEHYGYEAQSNQLIEECAELIQAVNKYRRAGGKGGALSPSLEDPVIKALYDLMEEIADVELMLEQIKYLLQIKEEDILAIKQYKVNRTKDRMAGRG